MVAYPTSKIQRLCPIVSFASLSLSIKVARAEEETPAVEAPKMEDQEETADVTANDEQTEADEDETEDEVTEEDEETEEDEGTRVF